jgi:hypothetical protein
MDGQAIFTYSGAFPPAPSAWEKIFLGWTESVSFNPLSSEKTVSLTAAAKAADKDTVILKVPVTGTEYYLIENRQRDARKNYSAVKYISAGDTLTSVFQKDTTGYYSYAADSLKGVIIDVDDYDWALPGNGIVIWHVDEDIIKDKIGTNQINADSKNRGLAVVEADGIHDIGVQYTTIFGDEVVGEGTEEDFWYSGNSAKLYKNLFNDETLPSSKSNSGANSMLEFSDFSASGPVMTLKIKKGNTGVSPLFIFNTGLSAGTEDASLKAFSSGGQKYFVVKRGNTAEIINQTGQIITELYGNFKYDLFCHDQAGTPIVIGCMDDSLLFLSFKNNLPEKDYLKIDGGDKISSAPVLVYRNGVRQVAVSTLSGKICYYSFINTKPYIAAADAENADASGKTVIAADTTADIFCQNNGSLLSFGGKSINVANIASQILSKSQTAVTSEYCATVADTAGEITVATEGGNNGKSIKSFSISHKENNNAKYLLSGCDLKNDGNPYLVSANGLYLDVFNLQGASADNFPYKDLKGKGFNGSLLCADFTGDDAQEVIAVTNDGRIYALDGRSGAVVKGFPITAGSSLYGSIALCQDTDGMLLLAINDLGYLYAWHIGDKSGKIQWSQKYGSAGNSSFVSAAAASSVTSEFMPKDKTYNWPNPVYNGSTNIRYYVSEDSKIEIKIYDLAGGYVAELSGSARGGMDNETSWDVSKIQSGVYLARVKATGQSGKSETRVIKIAVIK